MFYFGVKGTQIVITHRIVEITKDVAYKAFEYVEKMLKYINELNCRLYHFLVYFLPI